MSTVSWSENLKFITFSFTNKLSMFLYITFKIANTLSILKNLYRMRFAKDYETFFFFDSDLNKSE